MELEDFNPSRKTQRKTKNPQKPSTLFNFIFTFSSHVMLSGIIFFKTRNDSGWRQSSICVQNTPNLTATPLQLQQLLMFKKLTKNSKNFSSPMRIRCSKTPRWIWKRGSEATWNHLQAIRISQSWAATVAALLLSSPLEGWEPTNTSMKAQSLPISLLPPSWRMPPNHPT